MFYIIVILAAIFTLPAKALDGARSPANVSPAIELNAFDGTPSPDRVPRLFRPAPLDLPPNLMSQAANPGGAAQAESLRGQVVGAWSLVSCTIRGFPWCVGPHDGIAILDASGHYAIVNTARGRPKFRDAASPRDAYSAEEYKAATMGLQAQFGTWSVDEAGKALMLHIDGALFPNVEGTDGRVTVSISGDEITLVNQFGTNVWRRIKR
jgi:hypothetical protein